MRKVNFRSGDSRTGQFTFFKRRTVKVKRAGSTFSALLLALTVSQSASFAATAVNISVNSSQTVRTVDERVFGVNTAIWDSAFNTADTLALFQDADTRALRFPGGSASDEYHWQTNKSLNNTWEWATRFDAFANIAVPLHPNVFITVNYGTGTAQEAADWVQYSNVVKGYGFKYWEIGNENYGGWETDSHQFKNDPYTYAVQARDYITLMKGIDPTIKIGVVAVTGEDSYANNMNHTATNPRTFRTHNGWTPVMLTTLKSLGVIPDYIIYHRYEQAPGQENDAALLQDAKTWPNDAADLRSQLNDYLGTATASNIELIVTENNSVYSNPGKQSTSLVNGLFLADSTAQLMQTEFNGLIWWDMRNGVDTTNNNGSNLYGWRMYGDYGVGSVSGGQYPTYYTSKLLKYFARGGDQVVKASTDNNLLAAYSARRKDGSLTLLVINKSPTTDMQARISIDGYIPDPSANLNSYGIPQDEAAHTNSGSKDVAQAGYPTAGGMFVYTFSPYSATVLSFVPTTKNPVDDAKFLVTQQYMDYLNRQPDIGGLQYWVDQIIECGIDENCLIDRRTAVSDAFFFEPEFQEGGAYLYRLYKTAYGAMPTYAQFQGDRGNIVAGPQLDQTKAAFALTFVQRPAFTTQYPASLNASDFVDQLINSVQAKSSVDLTSQRSTLISMYDGTSNGRATIMKAVADNSSVIDAEYNKAFVLMQYFGYLRRDIDPDGFNFWLGQVNRYPLRNTTIQQGITCAFITSQEYQARFSPVMTHSNRSCPEILPP